MTTLTFYNGLREIGGTFVVVETDEARCMFDFGFAVMDRMDDKIAVRYNECAADYARLGVLASQDGIYDEETAKTLGLVSFENDKKKNFFVISHMHIDHMGGLGMLDQNLPVYMSEDSLKLYRRLEACGDIQVKGHKNCIGIPYGESLRISNYDTGGNDLLYRRLSFPWLPSRDYKSVWTENEGCGCAYYRGCYSKL